MAEMSWRVRFGRKGSGRAPALVTLDDGLVDALPVLAVPPTSDAVRVPPRSRRSGCFAGCRRSRAAGMPLCLLFCRNLAWRMMRHALLRIDSICQRGPRQAAPISVTGRRCLICHRDACRWYRSPRVTSGQGRRQQLSVRPRTIRFRGRTAASRTSSR